MAKNNINDGKRFTDIRSLADVLHTTIEDATQIAINAKAVMRIGQKTWYDWDKCLDYAKAKVEPEITFDSVNWIDKHPGSNSSQYDVRVTLGTTTKRCRVSINKDSLGGFKTTPYANIGISGDYLVFDLAANTGFKVEGKGKSVCAFTIENDVVAKFKGNYMIKRSGDLFYIDIKEKQ